MSNATRYLCAAAYLDPRFRERVLDEMLHDRFRAVAPSQGRFDLGPVIQHCREARTMLLVREMLIAVLLLIGLYMQPWATIAWVSLLVPFALLSLDRVREGPPVVRWLIRAWAAYSVLVLLISTLIWLAYLVLGSVLAGIAGALGSALTLLGATPLVVGTILVPFATLVVTVGYRIAIYLKLVGSLRPGSPEPDIPTLDAKTARRIDYVRRAQWGNVTMYANEDAFMGAGEIQRVWSIAVELDRVRGEGAVRRERDPVDIDPVELHEFVRARLRGMRDHVLRHNESIQALDIGDHVVTRGAFTTTDWAWGRAHPLITGADPQRVAEGLERAEDAGLPRYHVTPQEAAAIMRHPQGGVRYYQRVTVGGIGQEIRDASGRLIAPAEDQQALTSAFIYLAVEGRMLYTQFVVTTLPPVQPIYHVVDALPAMSSPRVAWEAVRALKTHLLLDVVAAPFRLFGYGWKAVTQAMTQTDPADALIYQYGARFSVREVGAAPELQTYIQLLDAAKYTKLIEQRLTAAVLDFLEDQNVDTADYRRQAANVTNGSVWVGPGGTVGPISFGANSSATVNNVGQASG
ncbi:hypothetical protein [Sphaerisporangium sp. TRM90804]|uniref:hypothetical protein n=1 Tax=Sphaerisporangium sp. TRM90804 TaxID=3031113 RepID=UPI002449F7E2|nr:hypothetical protein [Sphaerisporangium sp. TRM90804]MDH2429665.1 hypothetical protein [Sphaerisporangium sp. TRM90804]